MSDRVNPQSQRMIWLVLGGVVLAVGLVITIWYVLTSLREDEAAPGTSLELLDAETPQVGLLLGSGGNASPTPTATPTPAPTPAPVVVYISGAVAQPDVYELPHDARVIDVVRAAGGLTDDADSERVNLAARIHDAEHIHVPRVGEPAPPPDANTEAPAGSESSSSGPININTASAAELTELDGIGDIMAQRIVDYRNANGPFASIENLQDVQGIGSTLLEQMRPWITVNDS